MIVIFVVVDDDGSVVLVPQRVRSRTYMEKNQRRKKIHTLNIQQFWLMHSGRKRDSGGKGADPFAHNVR